MSATAWPASPATSFRVLCGWIYRDDSVICGPIATTLLLTMIHPSLVAADRSLSVVEWPLLAQYGHPAQRCRRLCALPGEPSLISSGHRKVRQFQRALMKARGRGSAGRGCLSKNGGIARFARNRANMQIAPRNDKRYFGRIDRLRTS